MKKLFKMAWLFMSAIMLFSAYGCGGAPEEESADSVLAATSEDTVTEKSAAKAEDEDAVSAEIDFYGEVAAENIKAVRASAWAKYLESIRTDEKRKDEVASSEMAFGKAVMRYEHFVIGEPDENGYPLFIAMHGGGQSDTPDVNDQQWNHMKEYYRTSVENGVYVAVRGVRDTWDTHFNPESYPLYDRLIENMIVFENVDPNRVYIMGFSAGGDGVYAIAPRMSDRFAAASMSAGHPNGVSLVNLYNLPIILQCGELDDAYDRNTITAKYGLKLDELEKNSGGYIHTVNIHTGEGHNFRDNDPLRNEYEVIADNKKWLDGEDAGEKAVNSNAVDFLTEFTRNPLPESVIWDLTTRAGERESESFYWLSAPKNLTRGTITASYDRTLNRITIETKRITAGFSILLNDDMVDFSKPVEVIMNGEAFFTDITADSSFILETTLERGDCNYQFAAKIDLE